MLKVLVADDHPLFREAVVLAIKHLGEDSEIFEAGTLDEACSVAAEVPQLDLLLLDLRMPGANGLSGLLELRRRFPALPVVVVSATEEPRVIREAIASGAMGFVPKSLDRSAIGEALRHVLAGETWQPDGDGAVSAADNAVPVARRLETLTPQQDNILRLMVAGKPNKIIAYELDIAETTVKAHVTLILRKLGVFSRTQAVLAVRDFVA
ncbi:MAG: response regulator transcription factor [Geminicoccaceae bacterium]